MGFLSPWFLGGLSAIALPVYVHLLRQHRSTPLQFASVMLFEQRTQSSVKHRRLKYLALLAARILTIALLALTFAGFYVGCTAPPSARNTLTLVAVDRSLSMKAGGRMEAAKREAASLLARAAGTGQVIAFDSSAAVLTQAVTDKPALQAAVQSITAGDGRSAYGSLSRTIASIAHAAGRPVQAHIISDMQRSSLPSPFSELALPDNVKLVLHPVEESVSPNWYVENVMAPRQVYGSGKVRVDGVVAGTNTPASEVNVTLLLNGRNAGSRKVAVSPGSRAGAGFELSDIPYGFNRGELRIEASDALRQDNVFPFAIDRKETSRVLFIGGERAALYYRTALESVPNSGFTVDVATTEQAQHAALDKYAMVVLSDVRTPPAAVTAYVNRGGGALILLGPMSAAEPRVPVAGDRILDTSYASRQGERFESASSVDASHQAVASVRGFEGVKFYQAVRTDASGSRVLARLSDGSPLVSERKAGDGRVIVFASTFDNISNDLPLHPSFVPFVEMTARYLSEFEQGKPDYTVGSFVELRSARESGTGVEVIGPDGKRALSLSETTRLPSFQLPSEGFFEIRRANGRHELIAAHTDRRESDLTPIPKDTLSLWQNSGAGESAGAPARLQNGEERRDLWWYFALALLLTSLFESIFASRYLAAERPTVAVRKQAA